MLADRKRICWWPSKRAGHAGSRDGGPQWPAVQRLPGDWRDCPSGRARCSASHGTCWWPARAASRRAATDGAAAVTHRHRHERGSLRQLCRWAAHVPDGTGRHAVALHRHRRSRGQRALGQQPGAASHGARWPHRCADLLRRPRRHRALHRRGRTWRAVASGTDGVLRKALVEPGTGNLLLVGGQGTLRARAMAAAAGRCCPRTARATSAARWRYPAAGIWCWWVNASCDSCENPRAYANNPYARQDLQPAFRRQLSIDARFHRPRVLGHLRRQRLSSRHAAGPVAVRHVRRSTPCSPSTRCFSR